MWMRVLGGLCVVLGFWACSRAADDPGPTWPSAPAGATAASGWNTDNTPPAAEKQEPLSGFASSAPHLPAATWAPATRSVVGQFPAHGLVFHELAHVFSEPRAGARAIGYFRRGARLRLGEEVGRDGCSSGWHGVAGGGYVCRGQGYRVAGDAFARPPEQLPPDTSASLPYRYVKVVRPTAQTWRIPDPSEDEIVKELLRAVARDAASQPAAAAATGPAMPDAAPPASALPPGVTAGEQGTVPQLPGWIRMIDAPGHYLSVASETRRRDGSLFLRSVRGAYIPASSTLPVAAPPPYGQPLGSELQLPLGFGQRAKAGRGRLDARSGRLRRQKSERPPRSVALTGAARDEDGKRFVEAGDGVWWQASALTIAETTTRPAQIPAEDRWIHVDPERQTLVAYEGERPVFATLVSTGKLGFETPPGLHRIHAKHLTTTMDDLGGDEGTYYIEDVPWTLYFDGGHALHGAFWHSRFGRPRSHGCVNLAPADARWVFRWTLPTMPEGRHGALIQPQNGTWVWIAATGAS